MSEPTLARTIESAVLALPPDKQQEVLDFALFLRQRSEPLKQGSNLRGLWADLKVDLSESDLSSARADIWKTFPRSDF